MRLRRLLFLVIVLVVIAVGVATWRGSGPLAHPQGCRATVAGHQVTLSTEQAENASLIAAIGVRRGLPARAVSIALATAYQESKIRNLPHGDRDSIGLFQQRPSQGWGTAAQIQDPYFAINAFYDALQKVKDYQTMPITVAAQRVQRSGYPEAYAVHAEDARALASALTGYSPGGKFTCVVRSTNQRQSAVEVTRVLRQAYGGLDVARTGARQDLRVGVGAGENGQRLGWSVAQFLVAHGTTMWPREVRFAGKAWRTGRDSEQGWVPAKASAPAEVRVALG